MMFLSECILVVRILFWFNFVLWVKRSFKSIFTTQKTKFNLLREEYFRAGSIYPGARQKGETWRIMKSSVGQEMRFC